MSQGSKIRQVKLILISNDINDNSFKNVLCDLFEYTPALVELEISRNFISGESLQDLSTHFRQNLKFLEKMNFSNNWIDSFIGDDFFDKSLSFLHKLTFINLSKNFLDNDFLKQLDHYLRKNRSDKNPEILIDLTKNRFDSHLLRYKFYQWKPEEEVEKNDRLYSVHHFVENLTKMKVKLKFKFDLIKHYREKESDVTKKVTENIKNYSIKVYTTNEGIGDHCTSLTLYKELDEMISEMDNFFDPTNIKTRYARSETVLERDRSGENSCSSDIFSPNSSIEDFYTIFKKIKNFKMNITYIQLHRFINKLKIEVYQSIREKNIYDMNFLNKICDYFKTSNMEKLHAEYSRLQCRSKTIMDGLVDILNFEGNLSEKNKNFFNEINNFLDIFLHEADAINLKNDLILIAKYLQFIRNNKLRGRFFSVYENILKEESVIKLFI